MGWMSEGLPRQPSAIDLRPGRAALINSAMAQQKSLKRLARLPQSVVRPFTGSHEVAYRFMYLIRHPHRGQLAGTVQSCEAYGIAPVGLDPIARALGNKRWRHHLAVMAKPGDLAMEVVAGRACLAAEVKLSAPFCQLVHHRRYRRRLC